MTSFQTMARRALPLCVTSIRIGLGCMFIYSALQKIRQAYDFLGNVYDYQLVGPTLGLIVAVILPWLELGIGISLVGGVFAAGSLLISMSLAAVFVFVVATALYHGLVIGCGCFGSSPDDIINYATLVRAIVILLASAFAYMGTILLQASRDERAGAIQTMRPSPTPPVQSSTDPQLLANPV